ncbi:efflux RND transporter permease subunit [Noviherbaspirillum sedimenti]|uniref:RND family transporter n=1 Tax=Noviherbaspirillum sedimenti TaxID=2320865 RepID=A0A3A3GQA0_9BURK|nr:MMPL family transporter [Noviherbaspirillum sedimenti]RJG03160.1 RND family transporter [Noviherbaspirillum sedimenti]
MAIGPDPVSTTLEVIRNPEDFDKKSGNFLERLIFNHRFTVLFICAIITGILGFQALKIDINASYEGMMPRSHPFVKNYLENRDTLSGLGNTVRVVVENKNGDIFDPAYLATLAKINDALYLADGVDRSWLKSLWTPLVRWFEVTEEGFSGGPVMPENYDGSPESIKQLRENVQSAGLVGNLVSNDYRSSMIVVPLLEKYSDTGKPLDYRALSHLLEEQARAQAGDNTRVYIIGFAKAAGDLIDGLVKVITFFLAAAVTAAIFIYLFTRCVRSTALVLACSVVAVIWQLGIMVLLGKGLDPFTVLVPFLVFAIGVSHAAQKMNGIMQDIGRGNHKWVAARYTFRRLIIAGLTALLADAVGFAVLMVIDIPVIRDLALSASIGVAILIFTNLFLLPVLLSYTGVSKTAAENSLREESKESSGRGFGKFWNFLDRFTQRKWAIGAIVPSFIVAAVCVVVSMDLKIGDLDPGAPELRADSRYNQDVAFVNRNFGLSSDVFSVMVKTPKGGCMDFETMVDADRLSQKLREVPGVQTVGSFVDSTKAIIMGNYEGNPKWLTVSRDPAVINNAGSRATSWGTDQVDTDCTLMPVNAYLVDHKADTLARVVKSASEFAAEHNTENRQFLLAAGSAGIDAATNEVVKKENYRMLLYVYAAVIVLCFIAFRSWRAVVVAVVPLMITSILAEALMVALGIGVKVATLPVIALGVGIGVDYALYLLSVQLAQQRAGVPLEQAFRTAVAFTGKVVALIGLTLAAGVVTWAWSPIKFQADMGLLLAFMFLWNMVGCLILVPALSHFLLRNVQQSKPAEKASVHPVAQPKNQAAPKMRVESVAVVK